MKSFAGGRLCSKKPTTAPSSTKSKPATNSCGRLVVGSGANSNTAASMPAAITATPPESESILSSMLNELTSVTIQNTESAIVSHCQGKNAVNCIRGTSHTHAV